MNPASPADSSARASEGTAGRPTVLVVLGTRPEAIKLAPVIAALEATGALRVRVLFTGQHRELLDQVAGVFALRADRDLQLMRPGQTLPELTSRLATGLDEVLEAEAPDAVLAQGDTTTVLMTSLACYYRKIPFGHVEAGLRTPSLYSPFPEEANRRLTSVLSTWHFAPTETSAAALLREGVDPAAVHMTGNTVVDALLDIASRNLAPPVPLDPKRRLILMTLHRRESFGGALADALGAVRQVLDAREDVEVIWPVHPNPNVVGPAQELLGHHPRARLIDPIPYTDFVTLMKRATILMSDSGGVQEEAPSLGIPLLVLRESTERPEGVAAGVARLVGTDPTTIVREALRLLDDPAARQAMQTATSPYGDGQASRRIAEILVKALT